MRAYYGLTWFQTPISMGEAKRRGTREQRAADPKGNPHHRPLTEEQLEGIRQHLMKTVETIRDQLFRPCKPKRARKRYPRTGG